MKVLRLVDANINRVSEGIRVIEDINRFLYDDEYMSNELRKLRHRVRKTFNDGTIIMYRNSEEDIGLKNSKSNGLDRKTDLEDLIVANFKRAEEGIRVIEECLKLLGLEAESKEYESIRFKLYGLEKKMYIRRTALNSDIYAILGQDFSRTGDNVSDTELLAKAGVKIVQYREKNKSKEDKYRECLKIREITRDYGMFFIVNDDLDLALAANSDGLHIGQDDLDYSMVKKAAPHLIVGLSTHTREEAMEAERLGADYIGVGPVFETRTKEIEAGIGGLDYLEWVSQEVSLPYVAIGGIREENIKEVQLKGAYCFAMISDLVGAEDIGRKVKNIRRKLREE